MKTEKPMNTTKPKLQRCKNPKRIWIRSLQNGKVAVAEYSRAKRYNIVDPFKPDSDNAPYGYLRMRIAEFERLNPGRKCVAVLSYNDFNAKHVADVLELPNEI